MIKTPSEWVDNEDRAERHDRIERLKWLAARMSDVQMAAFWTGAISLHLFEEARYCFVYGQYLASVVLALSFIEQALAGYFYGIGRGTLNERNWLSLPEKQETAI